MSALQVWLYMALLGAFAASLKLVGPAVARKMPTTGFWRRFLDQLPQHLLCAMMMPALLHPDWRYSLCAWVALLSRVAGGAIFLAMFLSMATLALLRLSFP
jgi:branched-subunit amino acid transport protein